MPVADCQMPNIDSLFQKAVQAHQSGDVDGAVALYREVLAAAPQHAEALHMLGVIAQQRGNTELGLKLTEAALAINPTLALAWYNRSLMLRVLGKSREALDSVTEALRLNANLDDAWDMAGSLWREHGDLDKAAHHHAMAVKLRPENILYRSNYAILQMSRDDLKGAYQTVKDSERLDVDCISFALGNVLRASGYSEQSIPHYQRVSRLMPNSPEAMMNEAMAWLQIGEFKKAWPIWKRLPNNAEGLQHIPPWNGEKVKHLLLHEEQGMGDALQCVRYFPLLRLRAEHITLRLNAALQRLMQYSFPDATVITLTDPVPDADARTQLMQLPALFDADLSTLPADIPYLKVDESWHAPWPARLQPVQAPRVGFVWAGNPGHRNNRNRSIALQQLKPVTDVAAGHGVSLQKWSQKDEAGLAASGLFDADPYLNDFTDTAGLMQELDVVITVDTSVAHLAGAFGKPVWVLVPFDPDWRWMLGREDSPWYPTLRLFRQTAPRDWDSVFVRIAAELKKLLAGDRLVLQPQRWQGQPLRQNPHAIDLEN